MENANLETESAKAVKRKQLWRSLYDNMLNLNLAIMLVTYFVNFRKLNDHLFGKELFIRFTASAFRKLSSIYVFSYFPFGFEGRMWNLIVSVPDHCLSFYFELDLYTCFRITIVQNCIG